MASNDNTNPGTQGDQVIAGTAGSDTLTGAFGSDTVNGGDGNDELRGDGGVQGSWHFETFDYNFSSSAGQAFDIENGVRTGSGYVSDFNEGGLTNTVRGTTGNPEDFGVIYTSTLNTATGGTYRLTTASDDGSTIQIFNSSGNALNFANQTGGTLNYLNNDFHQGTTTRFGDVVLDPNETYTIQIRYWENAGGDTLSATINGPDTGGATQNLLTSPMIGLPPEPGYSVTGVPSGVQGNDSIDGGAGNDTISGDGGNDTLLSGSGNDSVSGGTGSDSIDGGTGDDTLLGGDGNDIILGGDGADSISGGDGADQIGGGIGNDTILGGTGNDTIFGGAGADNISGGSGDDSLLGGNDNDTIEGGTGNDLVNGGNGDDSLAGGDGDDTLLAGFGTDTMDGGDGIDTYDVSLGNSSFLSYDVNLETGTDQYGNQYSNIENVIGGSAADAIAGDGGNNELSGLGGNDTLDGGEGDDTLSGGAGNDTFIYNVGDGNDTISDFNTGNGGTLDDGDSTNNDFINLSGYYDHISELYADQADDGVLNQSNATDTRGNSTDYSDNTQFGGGSLRVQGASADNTSFTEENTGVVCFTSGTAIRTPRGDILIDDLRIGDLVSTADNGPQPIRWIGRRTLDHTILKAAANLRPVLFKPNVLGNTRPLLVSPQHCMILGPNRFVRARHLAEWMQGVRIAHGKRDVTYIHLMFDAHQVIFAENALSESFYPGPMSLEMMGNSACAELFGLFPELRDDPTCRDHIVGTYGGTARRIIKKRELPETLALLSSSGMVPKSVLCQI